MSLFVFVIIASGGGAAAAVFVLLSCVRNAFPLLRQHVYIFISSLCRIFESISGEFKYIYLTPASLFFLTPSPYSLAERKKKWESVSVHKHKHFAIWMKDFIFNIILYCMLDIVFSLFFVSSLVFCLFLLRSVTLSLNLQSKVKSCLLSGCFTKLLVMLSQLFIFKSLRVFFAPHNKENNINIHTYSSTFSTRDGTK